MARIIGIDFGEKRIGVAATDALQIIANSVATVPTEEIYDFLEKYIQHEEVERFVIGQPKTLQNEPAIVMEKIQKFSRKLKAMFPTIDIVFLDERFTSVLAQRAIIDGGVKKKARQNKALLDQVSATIILQDYLEQHKYQ